MDPQRARRQREPRRAPLPQAAQRDRLRRLPRRADVRRGVDGVADGVAADRRRRARLRLQVGHGVDARHPRATSRDDPIHRRYHHDELTFRMVYAFTENFVLPLSHDEVVHGKGSLLAKMPGDRWQQLRQPARCSSATSTRQPGKKLLFMGAELAQDDGVEPRPRAPLVPADRARPRGRPPLGRPPQRGCTAPSRRCTSSTATPPASSGSTPSDTAAQRALVPAPADATRRRRRPRPARAGRRQPHAGAAPGLPHRGARAAAGGSSSPTATPRSTAAAGWGNLGGVDAVERCPWSTVRASRFTLPPLGVVFLAPEGPTRNAAARPIARWAGRHEPFEIASIR